jgi:hypothetical protein
LAHAAQSARVLRIFLEWQALPATPIILQAA